MKLIICVECETAFTPTSRVQKCTCGKSSARVVNGITHYSGSSARAYNIYDADILSDIDLDDRTAIPELSSKKLLNEEDRLFCTKVLEYLNEKAGTKHTTKFPSTNTQLIISRRDEHQCSLEDFYRIIDNKVVKWLGTDFEMYLRPSTLFNKSKFTNYLGEKNATPNKPTTTSSSIEKLADTASQAKRNIISRGE